MKLKKSTWLVTLCPFQKRLLVVHKYAEYLPPSGAHCRRKSSYTTCFVKAVVPREAHHSIMDPETLVEWEPIPGHTPPLARVVIDWYGEPLPSQDVLTMKLEVDEDGNLTGGVGVVMGSSDEEDYSDDSSDDIFNNSSDDRTAHAHGDDSSGG